jgi:anti-sigma B factor antagonist
MNTPSCFDAALVHVDGHAVVRVVGELDLATARTMVVVAEAGLAATNGPLVLEMSGVSFCDSSGLRALLSVEEHARTAQRRVVLRQPTIAVRRILDLAHVERFFTIE